jgi:hypothetical protein
VDKFFLNVKICKKPSLSKLAAHLMPFLPITKKTVAYQKKLLQLALAIMLKPLPM